jgi:branched-chain amino acid transport system ATP-binding protein
MLDEPMAGVNPALTQGLLGHVKDLAAEGITVVFVEHDMDVVRDISNWVVVMAEGTIIAEGPHDTITTNKSVIDAYLGTHHDAPLTPQEATEWIAEDEAIVDEEEEEHDETLAEIEEEKKHHE